MQPLEISQLKKLPPVELASRIDAFLQEEWEARFGRDFRNVGAVRAIDMLNTKAITDLEVPHKIRALGLFYRARFQVLLCMEYLGGVNRVLRLADDEDELSWANPMIQVKNASMRQASIVSARIAFECLMEFIYSVEEGRLIPSSKSKRGIFRKWCSQRGNRFGWMVFYLLIIQRFDGDHRSPEIHGTSYVAMDALACNAWPRQDGELDAQNLMQDIWPSVQRTLNGEVVNSCHYSPPRDEHIFKDFFNWPNVDLAAVWRRHSRSPLPNGAE